MPHDSVLSPRSMQRYSRQMLLPDFGAAGARPGRTHLTILAGQVRLLNTKVLVIGAGGTVGERRRLIPDVKQELEALQSCTLRLLVLVRSTLPTMLLTPPSLARDYRQ